MRELRDRARGPGRAERQRDAGLRARDRGARSTSRPGGSAAAARRGTSWPATGTTIRRGWRSTAWRAAPSGSSCSAGACSSRTAPRLNGGFLVFLPLSTRIATVRVTVDGKATAPRSARSQPPKQARASAAVRAGRRRGARAPGGRPLRAGLRPVPDQDRQARGDRSTTRPAGCRGCCGSSTPTGSWSTRRRARWRRRGGSGAAAACSSAACAAPRSAGSTPTGSSARPDRVPAAAVHGAQAPGPGGAARVDARRRRPGRSGDHRLGRVGLHPGRAGRDRVRRGQRRRRGEGQRRRVPAARAASTRGRTSRACAAAARRCGSAPRRLPSAITRRLTSRR